ncbi:MAG: sulfatase-like hydrolase/transferase [Treponema sp.]|nr:sulfatase-like hydrolase/transferase [Treponema sp.]
MKDRPDKDRPNILLIMCDQLCASVLEAYGGNADTPNINKLAQNGVLFSGAYCQTPICSPSRASIITGLYPHRHGIVSNVMRVDYPIVGGPATEEGIDGRDTTTEGLLNNNGYNTVHWGKWHICGTRLDCYKEMYTENHEYTAEIKETFERVEKGPREKYMEWYGWRIPVTVDPEYARCTADIPFHWDQNRRFIDFIKKAGRLDLPAEDTFDYRTCSRSVETIKNISEPFMLTCSFNMPHDPNAAPSPYYENVNLQNIHADAGLPCDAAYVNDMSRDFSAHFGNVYLRENLRTYYAAIKLIDDQIGRLLSALRERGIAENTAVIFIADHGDMAGGHGMFWKSTRAFYDEVARVPMIISAPGFGKGKHYENPVELVDLMPTILELCGQKIPAGIDGESLVPALEGSRLKKDTAICERLNFDADHKRRPHTNDKNHNFMLRAGDLKYIIHFNEREDIRILYDLKKDPNEYVNVYADPRYSSEAAGIHEMLVKRLAKSGFLL